MSFHDWEKTAFLDPSHIKFMFKITKFKKKTFFIIFINIFVFIQEGQEQEVQKVAEEQQESREARGAPVQPLLSCSRDPDLAQCLLVQDTNHLLLTVL